MLRIDPQRLLQVATGLAPTASLQLAHRQIIAGGAVFGCQTEGVAETLDRSGKLSAGVVAQAKSPGATWSFRGSLRGTKAASPTRS